MEKRELTTEEKIIKFNTYLSETLDYYKRLAIQNIEQDKKSEKVDITKNVYLELSNRFTYLFKDEITTELINKEIREELEEC